MEFYVTCFEILLMDEFLICYEKNNIYYDFFFHLLSFYIKYKKIEEKIIIELKIEINQNRKVLIDFDDFWIYYRIFSFAYYRHSSFRNI